MKKISELDLGFDAEQSSDHLDLVRRAVENMTARDHHPKLENWIIANFSMALNRQGGRSFEWTRRCKRTDCSVDDQPPDFLISEALDSTPQFVEVTEVLDPDRKRQREYRDTFDKVQKCGIEFAVRELPDTPASYESDLIERAREVLQKKLAKRYPRGTWLIVYFNPQLIAPRGEDSHSFGLKVLRQAIALCAPPDRLGQIWLLSNTLKIDRML